MPKSRAIYFLVRQRQRILRRGVLYRVAREEGCEAIVLGHHREDALATFMMNKTRGGRLASMSGKLLNDAGDVTVLRPLIETVENDLAKYTAALGCPIIPCNLCGSQDGLQRQLMARRLQDWEQQAPCTKTSMLKAGCALRRLPTSPASPATPATRETSASAASAG